ncbi:MAG: type II toxin-antitoxin system VapC family toxin [Egibacteraceae bacterium]
MSLFVDTSAWYAAADRGDSSNDRAKAILSGDERLVTSDHVLVETWLLLRHRLSRSAAERFWQGLQGGLATIEPVGLADLQVALAISQQFADQDFSIVDLTSFAVMQRLGVQRAASFDQDFAIYRYGKRRDMAFTVVR